LKESKPSRWCDTFYTQSTVKLFGRTSRNYRKCIPFLFYVWNFRSSVSILSITYKHFFFDIMHFHHVRYSALYIIPYTDDGISIISICNCKRYNSNRTAAANYTYQPYQFHSNRIFICLVWLHFPCQLVCCIRYYSSLLFIVFANILFSLIRSLQLLILHFYSPTDYNL
jgi:hypothetical protein